MSQGPDKQDPSEKASRLKWAKALLECRDATRERLRNFESVHLRVFDADEQTWSIDDEDTVQGFLSLQSTKNAEEISVKKLAETLDRPLRGLPVGPRTLGDLRVILVQ